ncbi:MAG: hypothetical protein HC919_03500 [Oscillatoriales cyanobacterium SM2_2_1]|nr:hypothetical protein [Oscillatoriales cyanobacterium SM2_2_1]
MPSPQPSVTPTTALPTMMPTAFPTYSAAAEAKAKRQRLQQYKIRGLEALGVTMVCAMLSLGAIAALTRLLPYKDSLQDRLTDIDSQVVELQTSVESAKERLQSSLSTGEQVRTMYNREGYILRGQKIVRLRDTQQVNQDPPGSTTTSDRTESP